MRKTLLFTLIITCTVFILNACKDLSAEDKKEPAIEKEDLVERGAYLVTIMGCDDCHSPKKMGPNGPELIAELRLSGHPANTPLPPVDAAALTGKGWALLWADLTTAIGPWGQTYGANLTSDSTGIGNWTEDQFRNALTKGKYKGLDNTRPLMPPMPWMNFRNIKDEDLKAIFAFLKSTKPVHNVVPEAKLNPPPSM